MISWRSSGHLIFSFHKKRHLPCKRITRSNCAQEAQKERKIPKWQASCITLHEKDILPSLRVMQCSLSASWIPQASVAVPLTNRLESTIWSKPLSGLRTDQKYFLHCTKCKGALGWTGNSKERFLVSSLNKSRLDFEKLKVCTRVGDDSLETHFGWNGRLHARS